MHLSGGRCNVKGSVHLVLGFLIHTLRVIIVSYSAIRGLRGTNIMWDIFHTCHSCSIKRRIVCLRFLSNIFQFVLVYLISNRVVNKIQIMLI